MTNRTALTTEQKALAGKHVRFAKSLAEPLKRRWPRHAHEFDSAAMLALVEAARRFQPERNIPFVNFASHRVVGAFKDARRSIVMKGYRDNLENAPTLFNVNLLTDVGIRHFGESPDRPVGHEIEAVDQVEAWLKMLPRRHAAVCRDLYVNDRTQREVARRMGIVVSRVCSIHREALAILRDFLGEKKRGAGC